jgi:imidazolonepropionase
LAANLSRLSQEMARSGTTTFEAKSGYGLTVGLESRSVRLARAVTDEVTFLGAHVVPDEYAGDRDAYLAEVTGHMLASCLPFSSWIDVFCEQGAFSPAESLEVLRAGIAVGLGARIHANQLRAGAGVRIGVEVGAASVDHCTHLSATDIRLLSEVTPRGSALDPRSATTPADPSGGTVATLLPGAEFATRSPYPDARALISAGAAVALATDCNPGSSYTTSMSLCVALAVREMRMTPAEAVWAATAGGAVALRRSDLGTVRVGGRADLVVLAATSHAHLAYRPGVDLIWRVWRGGQLVHQGVQDD